MRKTTILIITTMIILLSLQFASAEGNIVGSGTCGSCTWSVDDGGELIIRPTSGEEGTLAEWDTLPPWLQTDNYLPGTDLHRDPNKLSEHFTSVKIVGHIKATTCKYMFHRVRGRSGVSFTGMENLDTSEATDMSKMFMSVKSNNGWDFLKSLNTSKAKTMENMFWFSNVDLHQVEGWDVSSVENMSYMFDTVHIDDIKDTTIDLTAWDVSSVRDMTGMFSGFTFITQPYPPEKELIINLDGWNTGNVETMGGMFYVTDASEIKVGGWDTSSVTDMHYMFAESPYLKILDLSSFDTSKVINFQEFLFGCRPLRLVTGEKFTYAEDDTSLWFDYILDGYYEYLHDSENGIYHEKGSMMLRGAAVYACSAVVRFDPNGGNGEMSSQAFGWSLTNKALKKNTFTKEKHIFTGWNTKADGSGESYSADSKIGFDNLVSEDPQAFWSNYNVTLYAQWAPSFTVTYTDGEEGKVFDNQVYEVIEGTQTPPFNGILSREGYKFKGWNPDVDDVVNKDAVYTAQWEKDEESHEDIYTIVFDPNGGEIEGSTGSVSSEYRYGEIIRIIDAPDRDGYTFLYWKGSEYQPGDSYTVTENHTFTAQWKKDENDNTPSDKTPSDSSSPGKSHRGTRSNNSPRTGDDTAAAVWIAIMTSVIAGILIMLRKGRHRKHYRL